MTQLQSNASLVGIKLNLEPKPFNQVTAIGAPNCVVAKTSCNWDIANWGGWLVVRPRLLPVGRDAVPVRLRRQLRRLLQPRERRADQQTPRRAAPTALDNGRTTCHVRSRDIWQPRRL